MLADGRACFSVTAAKRSFTLLNRASRVIAMERREHHLMINALLVTYEAMLLAPD